MWSNVVCQDPSSPHSWATHRKCEACQGLGVSSSHRCDGCQGRGVIPLAICAISPTSARPQPTVPSGQQLMDKNLGIVAQPTVPPGFLPMPASAASAASAEARARHPGHRRAEPAPRAAVLARRQVTGLDAAAKFLLLLGSEGRNLVDLLEIGLQTALCGNGGLLGMARHCGGRCGPVYDSSRGSAAAPEERSGCVGTRIGP